MGVKTSELDLEGDESFLRKIVFPEEERRLLTTAPWDGSYRWFCSPNVIPLERYREVTREKHGAC